MSSTHILRENLKKVYPGPKWAARVDKMSDNQVIAVTRRLQAKNKI